MKIDDILKISIDKIYKSQEVMDKEIAGYEILAVLLDRYCQATHHYHAGKASNYDQLILKAEGKNFDYKNENILNKMNPYAH